MNSKSSAPPLQGVRILDFTWALVGSLSTKYLGDYGAEVIKVESMSRPCVSRFIKQVEASERKNPNDKPWFANLNTSKRSITLDLKHPDSRVLLEKLVKWADVVTENFSPGTMARLGLDYESLRQIRPDIIMASGSIYGQTGPLANLPGIDVTGAALSGRIHLTGDPDREPAIPAVPYGDVLLPKFIAGGVAAALDYRRRTGNGTHIDASMYEVLVQQLAYPHACAQTPDGVPERNGNRSEYALFQGVFRCSGEDNWLAVTLFNAEAWDDFTQLLEGQWPSAADVARMYNDDLETLESRVDEVTQPHDAYDLMEKLQSRGIAAGVAQDIAAVVRDPHLSHRQALKELDHPCLGRFGHQETPFRLERTPASMYRAPNIGEHTDEICREVLALSDEDIARLREQKVLV